MPASLRAAYVAAYVAVCIAIGGAATAHAQPAGSYASPALGALVDAAARDNRVPPTLLGYHATVESELGLALRREGGLEVLVAVEQVASTLRWARSGAYEQHVVGYRTQQAVPAASMLALFRTGWVAPVLYGERLLPPTPPDSSRGRSRRVRGAALSAVVHPLASDRARYYRFTGGDTVVTLHTPLAGGGTRAIPIVRVHVEPRDDVGELPRVGLFLGDVDIDAERHVVVRMRGQYLVASRPAPGLRGRLARAALQGFAFVEYETAERGGRYWLPTYQRLEFQAIAPVLGESRAVFRIVSRVRDVSLDTATTIAEVPNVDSAGAAARGRPRAWWRLTRAGGDTLSRFDDWNASLGALSGAAHADDFDDVAPDAWRTTGPPRIEPYAARSSDFVRFDRVQGLFTGAGVRVRFRDAAPGLTLRAAGGWAWAEGTARGRVELERELGAARRTSLGTRPDSAAGRWTIGARAARSLDVTNDFRNPLDSAESLGALLGSVDPYDYVDRRIATALARYALGSHAAALRVEVGAADDRAATRHVRRGVIGTDTFPPNRGIDAGRYVRTAVTAELHPDVAAEFVRPGVGARLFYERGDGTLDFQRVELRVVGRADVGVRWPGALRGSTLTTVARGDVGALVADMPPAQQLFELGGDQSLQGYDYKTFAGDRAGIVRGAVIYGSPWWRAPIRVGRVALPGASPGLSAAVEMGWTSASSAATRRAIDRLGVSDLAGESAPLSRPSDGVRATLDLGLRFFGGALFVGAARPIDGHDDRPRGWRRVVGVGVTP